VRGTEAAVRQRLLEQPGAQESMAEALFEARGAGQALSDAPVSSWSTP